MPAPAAAYRLAGVHVSSQGSLQLTIKKGATIQFTKILNAI